MEFIEIILIIAILCIQGYVAWLTYGQIESIGNFLGSEDNLKLVKTKADESNGQKVKELDEPVKVGKYLSAMDSVNYAEIDVFAAIHVGDLVYVESPKGDIRYGKVIDIFHKSNSVNYIDFGRTEVKLDCHVDREDTLFKIAEVVANVKSKPKTVRVIQVDETENSSLLANVVKTINNYLKKNKGAAADFHLVKDIVERHCDALDEEINHKLPVPIYLGLMGTVLGIIIGLFSLDFQYDPDTNSLNGQLFVQSVSGLISGVKLAMICSCIGLALTTILSSWLYKGAKAKLESQKNAFYDFIQTQLLPQMSRDASSTILSLQANLEKFNTSFKQNISDFGGIMDEIHSAFDSQVKLQKELKNMDIARVAHLNVNVLAQLRSSMTEFEKFTQYLNQMNSFVRSTAKLTDSINDQLERTEAVEMVTSAMKENIDRNQLVMEKLREFLERIDEKNAIITATGELDSTMTQAIEQLRSHAQEQIRSIQNYTEDATAELRELVTKEKGHLDKLNKLDSLEKLVVAINAMKDDNRAVTQSLEKRIEALAAATRNVGSGDGNVVVSGTPRWLKIVIGVIFIVTCYYVISGMRSVMRVINEQESQQQEQLNSYSADPAALDTTAVDTVDTVQYVND